MSELGITLNFKDQAMTWDDLTINMKDPESLADLLDPQGAFLAPGGPRFMPEMSK